MSRKPKISSAPPDHAFRWVSSEQLRGEKDATAFGVRKIFTTAIETHGDRTVKFKITSGAVDRERDVIDPKGWEVADFLRSPSVLFAHDYSAPPIGKALTVESTDDGLSSVVEFAPADVYPFADTIYRLVKGGYLNAASVGFKPLEWTYDEERRGMNFVRQSLLEWSVVPVGAHQDALVEARATGLDVEPLREWAAKTLERLGASGVARAGLTEIVTTAAGTTTTRIFGPGYALLPDDDPAPHAPEIEAAPAADLVQKVIPESEVAEKGVSPSDASTSKAPPDTAWSAPSLSDFTPDQWGDLTASEQRHIAGHYAWAAMMPPDAFGDMKLPHHRASDAAIVWRGVAAAAARMNQAQIPDTDMGAVRAHLARHYRAFDRTPPWEANASAWAEYERQVALWAKANPVSGPVGLSELAALLVANGFEAEALSLWNDPALKVAAKDFSDGDGIAPDAIYIDLAAITVDEVDDFKGLAPADVLAALRETIAAEVAGGVRAAVNGALGRVD